MNNIFRRPMFRKGGMASGGITSGLRQGYNTNENNLVQQNDFSKLGQVQSDLALLNQLAPAPVRQPSTAANDFMIGLGLNLASIPPQGNIFKQQRWLLKIHLLNFKNRNKKKIL